ncbi:MAG: molecular chaperone DjlA, partial [Planctomycetota bacterium]
PDLNDTYDPYQVLGITKGADKLTIKRAYRHLVN